MSGPMPYDRKEMLRAGYTLLSSDARCKSCGAAIEWWKTTRGKNMPFDAPLRPGDHHEEAVVHWATCPNAKEHKGTAAQATSSQPAARRESQGVDRFEDRCERLRVVQRLAEQMHARMVLVLMEEGHTWAAKLGLGPDDVQHELITAANAIRREMEQGR